jgi:hypothetical protein
MQFWIPLSPYYQNGVTDFGGSYQPGAFCIDNGRVLFRGVLSLPAISGVWPKLIATLPAGIAPTNDELMQAMYDQGMGNTMGDSVVAVSLLVDTSGNIKLMNISSVSNSGLTLNGCAFSLP